MTITSTKEDLVLASNKKIIAEGKDGGVKFGEYIPLSSKIINIYWMDESQENKIDEISSNQTVYLLAETETKEKGISVSILINLPDNSEVILNGVTDKDGIARIKWEQPIN